jgi:hypothetical protein
MIVSRDGSRLGKSTAPDSHGGTQDRNMPGVVHNHCTERRSELGSKHVIFVTKRRMQGGPRAGGLYGTRWQTRIRDCVGNRFLELLMLTNLGYVVSKLPATSLAAEEQGWKARSRSRQSSSSFWHVSQWRGYLDEQGQGRLMLSMRTARLSDARNK